jgi:hypothetical protein
MQRWSTRACFLALVIPLGSFALSPAVPDAGVVVYANRNLETVGRELRAAATNAGWHCERPEPSSPIAQNNLILQCRSPEGGGNIVADDYMDPLDRASVQGYSDADNLEQMLKILREFVQRVSKIPNARILFQQIPEKR